jgi:hypothetical protein
MTKHELIHELPLGSRVMRYGFGVQPGYSGTQEPLWWCRERRIWTSLEDNVSGLSSHAECRTVKAFKRHLRRHAKVLAGREVVWVGMYGNVTRQEF